MRFPPLATSVAAGLALGLPVLGNGVLRHGFGAADAATAGAFAGTAPDAMSAMQTNPAALAALDGGAWTIAGRAVAGSADFSRNGASYDMDVAGGFPEFAAAWRPGHSPLTLGISFAPLAALRSDWIYPDAPGGIGGISYGIVPHESGFIALRSNVALAWRLSDSLSLGASLGAVRSEVDFDAPFIFQTNPALAGAKVDLDLQTEGWAIMSEFGILWQPSENWSFGLNARPQVKLENRGSATADFSTQLPPLGLAGTAPFANYDASSSNALPFIAGASASWQATPRWRIGARIDWIGWSNAFDQLDVTLAGGTNGAINAAIGSSFSDSIPVGWEDRWVIALGTEYALTDAWTLRGGWRYGKSPAPAALVTPLNGPLPEHTLAAGAGWRMDPWRIDFSFDLGFGDTHHVGKSGYRAGEYDGSSLDIATRSFGLSVTRRF